MLRLTSDGARSLARRAGRAWDEHSPLAERDRGGSDPAAWLVAGVVIVGLGALAWAYLGPDLRRYMKIHSM